MVNDDCRCLSIVCMFVLLLSGIGCSLFMSELFPSSSYCDIIFLFRFWPHWALRASRLLVETTDGSKDAGSSTSFLTGTSMLHQRNRSRTDFGLHHWRFSDFITFSRFEDFWVRWLKSTEPPGEVCVWTSLSCPFTQSCCPKDRWFVIKNKKEEPTLE